MKKSRLRQPWSTRLISTIASAFAVISAIQTLAGPLIQTGQDNAGTEKSQYHLFNPTPRELMRDLSPDRPDATESPITLDAGHSGFEVSLFDWRHDGGDDTYTIMQGLRMKTAEHCRNYCRHPLLGSGADRIISFPRKAGRFTVKLQQIVHYNSRA